MYHRNQDRDQGRACHFTGRVLKALRSEQKNLVVTVLEVEIGPKATALDRRITFVVTRFDLGVGDMKVATIYIRIVKLLTPEPPAHTTERSEERRVV